MLCSRYISPMLRENASKKPRIVNISSGAASMYCGKEQNKDIVKLFDSKATTLDKIEELIHLKTKQEQEKETNINANLADSSQMSKYGFSKACLNTLTKKQETSL